MELHHYWLKSLLASGFAPQKIGKLEYLFRLPPINALELRELRKELEESKPTRVDPRFSSSILWLEKEGIAAACLSSAEFKKAETAILSDKAVRRMVEALLLSSMSYTDVTENVATRLGKSLTEADIAAFEHYFFNWREVPHATLSALFKSHHEGYTYRMIYTSKRPELALWKLGYRTSVDKDKAIELIKNEAIMRFLETGMLPNSMQTAVAADKWAAIFMAADTHGNGGNEQVTELLKTLRQLQMETIEVKPISIETLRGK